MTARRLSLAACSTLDAGPLATIAAAASAGYDGVGLRVPPDDLGARNLATLRTALDDSGLQLVDFEIVRLNGTGVARFEQLFDAAATLGARYVVTVSEDHDLARTTAEFAELAAFAAAAGLELSLEFVPYLGIGTLAQAVDVIRTSEVANAWLMVDALHVSRSGASAVELSPLLDLVGYLQICDAPLLSPPFAGLEFEAKHGRVAPGQGGLPLLDLLRAVPEVVLSVEVLSDDYEARYPPDERAALLLSWSRSLLAKL